MRRDDVFLVGHPKSGNTWVAYMLAIVISNDPDAVTLRNVGDMVPTVHGREWSVAMHRRLPGPRIFRNEWPQVPAAYPRTLYLVRDPRDVLVSYFHHYRSVRSTDEPMANFVDRYLRDGNIADFEPRLVRWDHQVREWLGRGRDQDVLVVRYEDMAADRVQVLRQVVEWLRLPVGPSAFDDAIRRGGFDQMREVEERFGAESYVDVAAPGSRFVRRGVVGSWRDEMAPDTARAVEEAMGDVMMQTGYL